MGKWPGTLTPCVIQARGFACLHSSFLGANRVNKPYLWGREGGARGELTPPFPHIHPRGQAYQVLHGAQVAGAVAVAIVV